MAIRFSLEQHGVTRTYALKRSTVTFGRARACTVHVDDPALSRTHCQLEVEEQSCYVRDLNSRNGTTLNGAPVDRAELEAGDQLAIGNTTITFLGQDDGEGLTSEKSATARWTARLFSRSGQAAGRTKGGEDEPDRSDEVRRLKRLLALNKKIAAELEPERVLTAILDSAVEFVDAERGFLVTVEEEESRLFIPVARDFWRKDIPLPAFEVSRSIALEVVRRGQAVITEDANQDTRFAEMVSVHDLKIRSVLCVPLTFQGRTIGAIYLDNRFTRGSFGPGDRVAIEAFADQAAISLVNSGLYEKTRRDSREWRERARERDRELRDVRAQLEQLEREGGLTHDYRSIIGRSPAMRECLGLVDRVMDTELSVLLCGESGTGKELIARALHESGPRRGAAFVALDCASFGPGLIESELFGHARGAFTGAVDERAGLFEAADGGTLFLDEIGDMELDQQKSLLRVLETGEIRRVGETRVRKVDVRIISATNQDLDADVSAGSFRPDLYYRLKGVRIDLPPLRERAGDITLLIRHFLGEAGDVIEISPRAMKALAAYSWPGNVRELKNEIDRLSTIGEGRITPADLPDAIARPKSRSELLPGGLKAHVEKVEKQLIAEALRAHDGNKTRASEALGLSRLGLRKKMARYGLE